MTGHEFKQIRTLLRYNQTQMATALGYSSYIEILRMEQREKAPISDRALSRLLSNWPNIVARHTKMLNEQASDFEEAKRLVSKLSPSPVTV